MKAVLQFSIVSVHLSIVFILRRIPCRKCGEEMKRKGTYQMVSVAYRLLRNTVWLNSFTSFRNRSLGCVG